MQQAYDQLSGKHGGGRRDARPGGGGGGHRRQQQQHQHHHQEQQRRQQHDFFGWGSRFWQEEEGGGEARQQGPRIPSATPSINTAAFMRSVLSGAGSQPWVLLVYADASPYCRQHAPAWEAAAKGMGAHARFGRIEWSSEPSLVQHLAAHTDRVERSWYYHQVMMTVITMTPSNASLLSPL